MGKKKEVVHRRRRVGRETDTYKKQSGKNIDNGKRQRGKEKREARVKIRRMGKEGSARERERERERESTKILFILRMS